MAREDEGEEKVSGRAGYVLEGSVLRVSGKLDAAEEEEFRRQGLALAEAGGGTVVLDLSGVSYIASSCLGAILILHEELAARDRRLKVLLPRALLYVYDLMGIRNVVETEVVT